MPKKKIQVGDTFKFSTPECNYEITIKNKKNGKTHTFSTYRKALVGEVKICNKSILDSEWEYILNNYIN
jgi:hypothetical protein